MDTRASSTGMQGSGGGGGSSGGSPAGATVRNGAALSAPELASASEVSSLEIRPRGPRASRLRNSAAAMLLCWALGGP